MSADLNNKAIHMPSEQRLRELGQLGSSLASLVASNDGTLGWSLELRSIWRAIVDKWEENEKYYGIIHAPEPVPEPRPAPQRVTCGECRFWQGKTEQCRRHPPINVAGEWPNTPASEWCGEGEPNQ